MICLCRTKKYSLYFSHYS